MKIFIIAQIVIKFEFFAFMIIKHNVEFQKMSL